MKPNDQMTTSDNGYNLIKTFEGKRNKPYLCSAGVPTIGYGTTRYPNGIKVSLNDEPITDKECDEYLRHFVVGVCERSIKENVLVPLTQNQFDALISFIYNVGGANFKSSTLLKLINSSDFENASKEFILWNKVTQGGQKVPSAGLTRRRNDETALFKSNETLCFKF